MGDKQIISGVVMDDSHSITFIEICESLHIAEQDLMELIEYGIVESRSQDIKRSELNYHAISRLQAALRMKYDLGINTPGVALVLELLDKLEALERDLDILQRHVEE